MVLLKKGIMCECVDFLGGFDKGLSKYVLSIPKFKAVFLNDSLTKFIEWVQFNKQNVVSKLK